MTGLRNRTEYTQVGDVLVKLDQFYSKQEAQPNGCIHYTGGSNHRQGYKFIGAVRMPASKRIMLTVHRLTLMIKENRALDPSEFAVHICSNPVCVNPHHIVLGDSSIRNQVMIRNGRQGERLRGKHVNDHKKQNRKYRYSEEEMLWIRYASRTEIAHRYNITEKRAASLRWAIRTNYRWLNERDNKYNASQEKPD
jgi:hypothetical protein